MYSLGVNPKLFPPAPSAACNANLNSSKLIQETKDEPAVYCSGMVIGRIDMLSEVLIILGISILLLTYSFLPALVIFTIIIVIILLYKNIFRKVSKSYREESFYFFY